MPDRPASTDQSRRSIETGGIGSRPKLRWKSGRISRPFPETSKQHQDSIYSGAAIIVIIATVILAYHVRFIQDDAFISFRYAENLVQGHGLAWAPGDFIQGYTNFLWVMIIAGALALGFEPVSSSMGLGLGLFAITLICTWVLALRVLRSTSLALCTLIVAAGNYSFLAYATGGLETQLHAALISVAALFAWTASDQARCRPAGLVALSTTLGLAGLTRLDSGVFIVAFSALALWAMFRRHRLTPPVVVPVLSLVLPGTLIMLLYFAWSYATYGHILPNTFFVKAGGLRTETILRGGAFVLHFGLAYGFLFIALGTIRAWPLLFRDPFRIAALAAIFLWTVYLTFVGGGFMEFRLFVVCIPFVALFAIDLLNAAGFVPARLRLIGIAATTLPFLLLSGAHGVLFRGGLGIESVRGLENHVRGPDQNWIGIGKALHDLFPESYASGPTISATAIGAISFYSKLPSIDMLGLNDAWVARNGVAIGSRPGHTIAAPLTYLLDRQVNLMVGHPHVFRPGETEISTACFSRYYGGGNFVKNVSPEREIPMLGMSLPDGFMVAMAYLTPHQSVEAAIASGRIRRLGENLSLESQCS